MADVKDPRELLLHQLGTYRTLRVVLAWIGFLLPFAVAVAGWLQCNDPPQWVAGSISAYYHRTALKEFLTARDIFVGGLLAGSAITQNVLPLVRLAVELEITSADPRGRRVR